MEIFIVATPIGNLNDITNRAIKILSEVDLIFAEDTRVTMKLLNKFNIQKKILSCNEFNESKRLEFLSKEFENIEKIAVVSDAGTPLISDPGKMIVKFAYENGIKVTPIPGVSAISTILSVTPFDTKNFIFLGFSEKNLKLKRENFQKLINLKYPFLFFESPKRVVDSITILKDLDTTLDIVIGRELTKVHEEIIFGNILEIYEKLSNINIKGEFVIAVSKTKKKDNEKFEFLDDIKILQELKISTKDIAYFISNKYNMKKNKIYNFLKNMEQQ